MCIHLQKLWGGRGGGPNDPLRLGLTCYSKKPGRPRVKSKTNFIDRKSLSNLRESKNFKGRSVRREKPLVKQFCNRKKNLSISCLLKESASILEQKYRSYGGLKLGLFVHFQRVPFGKSAQIQTAMLLCCNKNVFNYISSFCR